MRADEVVVISKAELDELKKKAEQRGQLFDAEEMQAIREQYVELVEAERERREELEFRMRMELARIRDIDQVGKAAMRPQQEGPLQTFASVPVGDFRFTRIKRRIYPANRHADGRIRSMRNREALVLSIRRDQE